MENDEKKADLQKENEALRQQLQEYKALEEDLMANRVFEKAKKQLWTFITLGGVILIAASIYGVKGLTDYAKGLAKEKMNAITQEEIQTFLKEEGQRQIVPLMQNAMQDIGKQLQEEGKKGQLQIAALVEEQKTVIVGVGQQQSQRVATSGQPVRGSRASEAPAATVATLDYTNQMPPARNQGQEGSVVAFAAAAALEYQIEKTLKKRVVISPRYIYYYSRIKDGSVNTDEGATIKAAVDVLRTRGAVAEETWSYKSGEFAAKPPTNIEEREHFRIAQAQGVRSVDELRGALQTFGPVIGGFPVYESFLSESVTKTGRVLMPGPKEKVIAGTAVCFVGFDDTNKLFKFRYSWGENWGDKGYGYIPYNYAANFLADTWAISMK